MEGVAEGVGWSLGVGSRRRISHCDFELKGEGEESLQCEAGLGLRRKKKKKKKKKKQI